MVIGTKLQNMSFPFAQPHDGPNPKQMVGSSLKHVDAGP